MWKALSQKELSFNLAPMPRGREVVPDHWLGIIETFPTHFVYHLAGIGKRGLWRVVQ